MLDLNIREECVLANVRARADDDASDDDEYDHFESSEEEAEVRRPVWIISLAFVRYLSLARKTRY